MNGISMSTSLTNVMTGLTTAFPDNTQVIMFFNGDGSPAGKKELNSVILSIIAAYQGATGVKVVDALPASPASGEENTIHRVPGTTTYTDYQWDGTQFKPLCTVGADSAAQAQMAYYACGTAADTAAKVVTATNGYELRNGGAMKVKFSLKNTAASGVTLKIGDAAAKDLYYCGQAVTDENTWENNETVTVYYDGTSYYANPVDVITPLKAEIQALIDAVAGLETIAEGYVRVAGSSSPALSYKSYKYNEQGGFGRESVFSLFYPCLIGTKLTGDNAQVGKILHVLQKLDYYHDIYGNDRLIDGSEGDVFITNIEPYYRIMGKHTINNTEYDVFLMSRAPFTWQGIEAERVEKFGWAPDYCVNHTDSDNVQRMHSVYNPAWNGSYQAPDSIVGKFVYSQNVATGEITEEYDEAATVLGGAGGLHTTDMTLYDGEQRAMNQNPDTTKCVPFMNHTAAGCENMQALLLAEGGTFDAHNASLMGSGFSSNDPATEAADWEASGSGAKNGVRIVDKNSALKYYSLGTDVKAWTGKSSSFQIAMMLNSWRNPWHIMEAHRAVMHAIKGGVHEQEWFVFEGNKYKWRSVNGFAGPAQGEMTCVVWKMISSKLGSKVVDPTDKTTSIAGNRIDFLVSTCLFHGMTTQVSPSWWTSGLIFTEDESQHYEAYMEREQASLIKSENGEIATSENFDFETLYKHVGSFTAGADYRKNYSNDALMLPDSDANKTGGGLHTYVCGYNYFTGAAASSGKKVVRGFRRGGYANLSYLSPLAMRAAFAPSNSYTYVAFGTCVEVVD